MISERMPTLCVLKIGASYLHNAVFILVAKAVENVVVVVVKIQQILVTWNSNFKINPNDINSKSSHKSFATSHNFEAQI